MNLGLCSSTVRKVKKKYGASNNFDPKDGIVKQTIDIQLIEEVKK